jgi:hypothetical protein
MFLTSSEPTSDKKLPNSKSQHQLRCNQRDEHHSDLREDTPLEHHPDVPQTSFDALPSTCEAILF